MSASWWRTNAIASSPILAESLAAASRVQADAGLAHEALMSARGAVTLFSDLTVAWPVAFVNRLEEALARLRAAQARVGTGAEDQELLSRGDEIVARARPVI